MQTALDKISGGLDVAGDAGRLSDGRTLLSARLITGSPMGRRACVRLEMLVHDKTAAKVCRWVCTYADTDMKFILHPHPFDRILETWADRNVEIAARFAAAREAVDEAVRKRPAIRRDDDTLFDTASRVEIEETA